MGRGNKSGAGLMDMEIRQECIMVIAEGFQLFKHWNQMDMGFETQRFSIPKPRILNNVNYVANKPCCCGIVNVKYTAK